MILVGQYDSPFVRRVAISLKLAGLQFTRDTRSVFADAGEMRRIALREFAVTAPAADEAMPPRGSGVA